MITATQKPKEEKPLVLKTTSLLYIQAPFIQTKLIKRNSHNQGKEKRMSEGNDPEKKAPIEKPVFEKIPEEKLNEGLAQLNQYIRNCFQLLEDASQYIERKQIIDHLGVAWGQYSLLMQKRAYYSGIETSDNLDNPELAFNIWFNGIMLQDLQELQKLAEETKDDGKAKEEEPEEEKEEKEESPPQSKEFLN